MSFLADRPLPYCKGCGHGLVARRLDEALVRLGVETDQVALTSDIGCVGLVDALFPGVHTVHTIHGRSTAVAAGAVLADRLLGDGRLKNVVMLGDGGATIGLLHLTQAALLNVDLTVLLHNNMLFGMTGGQHSGLTPMDFATSTTPGGNWVPAVDVEQVLRGCHVGYVARKLATDPDLADVIAEAIVYPGFALVEILELCTGFAVPLNHLSGTALKRMAEANGQSLGVLVKREDRRPYDQVYRERFPLDREARAQPAEAPPARSGAFEHRLTTPLGIVLAGSAGERVQTAAAILCQAAVLSGLHCTQKNDYPVTVGTGYSISEVQLSPEPILYTGIDAPNAVLVVSADGLREVQGRGDLQRLHPDGVILADEGLAASLPAQSTMLPLRSALAGDLAAFGAVAALVARTGMLERGALEAAIDARAGRDAGALLRAVAAAFHVMATAAPA